MARPLQGKERKEIVAIRIEPRLIKKIKKKYKKISTGINQILLEWENESKR
jgi:uncharacterized protein (DUF4415 family)